MKYIKNECTDPYYNLAFEEYILRNFKDDNYFLLWQNSNAVIIGRHQNTLKEINADEIELHNVSVVRRNSGGGAVYHDMGNVNFSFITGFIEGGNMGYDRFLQPVVNALEELGVYAVITGRNDLEINGKKVSGSAQTVIDERFLHHGTLLFDSDLFIMNAVLNVSQEKIKSKSIESVKSRVGCIKEYLPEKCDVIHFKENILRTFFRDSSLTEVHLTEDQELEIRRLRDEKYATWEWNYGKSPEANYYCEKRFPAGSVEVEMRITEGIISECKIWGDFLGVYDIAFVEQALSGCRYDRKTIIGLLKEIELKSYFGDISMEDIISCFV